MTATAKDIADAVCLMLFKWGITPIREYCLPNGRRIDVAGLGRDGSLLGVEVKISHSDFNRDLKWPDCMRYCKLYYFAVPTGFDESLIHPGIRLIKFENGIARITRSMGRGLLQPHLWHKATGRYAVNPPTAGALLHAAPQGDGARGRLWMP